MVHSRAVRLAVLMWVLLGAIPAEGPATDPNAPAASAAVRTSSAPTAPPVVGADADPSADPRARGLVRKIWWNNAEVVEALALSDEQRQRMDGHLQRFLRSRQEATSTRQAAEGDYLAALEEGRWPEARAALDRFGASSLRALTGQAEMKIDVLAELENGQRARLGESYPHLFRAPWYRPTRIGVSPEGRTERVPFRRRERKRDGRAAPAGPGSGSGPAPAVP